MGVSVLVYLWQLSGTSSTPKAIHEHKAVIADMGYL